MSIAYIANNSWVGRIKQILNGYHYMYPTHSHKSLYHEDTQTLLHTYIQSTQSNLGEVGYM